MTDTRFDATVTTTCGYCGVGCRLEAHAHGGKIASISPALEIWMPSAASLSMCWKFQ